MINFNKIHNFKITSHIFLTQHSPKNNSYSLSSFTYDPTTTSCILNDTLNQKDQFILLKRVLPQSPVINLEISQKPKEPQSPIFVKNGTREVFILNMNIS